MNNIISASKPDSNRLSGDLDHLSPKDRPWTRHRKTCDSFQVGLALSNEGALNFDPETYASRIAKCSQSLRFNVSEAPEGSKFTLVGARFCRVPICPICQWRKSLKWTARFIEGFTKLVQVYPDHEYLFLTLTIANCPIEELRAKIGVMVKGWDKLSKRKEFPAVGYIRSLEVTRNPKTGEAHPHFHCLLMVSPRYFDGRSYISQARWTELWREALQLPPGSPCIVNVKKVRSKKSKKSKADPLNPIDDVINGILEVSKYTVKPSDLVADLDWTIKMADQLFKLKKVSTGGIIKKFINDSDIDMEDLINVSGNELEINKQDYQLVFDWYSHVKKYLTRDIENLESE